MSFTGRPRRPPLALMSSSHIWYAARIALPFEARPPVKGMEKPILIGSAAIAGLAPSMMPVGSARAAAMNERRNIVLEPIGFAPWEYAISSLAMISVFQTGLARRDARNRRPVLVGIAVGDGVDERVAQHAGEGQRHVRLLARL